MTNQYSDKCGSAAVATRKSAVRIIGVPSGLAGRLPGPEHGPYALRKAGLLQAVTSAERSGLDLGDVTVYGDNPGELPSKDCKHQMAIAQTCESVAETVRLVLDRGEFPLVIGGDHSFAIGSLGAAGHYCREHGLRLGVLWVDAHPDLNTPETTPSGNIHGMVLGAALSMWEGPLAQIGGSPDLVPQALGYLGIRSCDPGEITAIKEQEIQAFSVSDVRAMGVPAVWTSLLNDCFAGIDYLHLSFDLDSADPSIAPGVSTPEPEGFLEHEMVQLLALVGEHPKFRSMDIAELNPLRDKNGITAELAVRLASIALSQGA